MTFSASRGSGPWLSAKREEASLIPVMEASHLVAQRVTVPTLQEHLEKMGLTANNKNGPLQSSLNSLVWSDEASYFCH